MNQNAAPGLLYPDTRRGIFLRRPNRFIAHVLVEGTEEICHVKNTGRCRELLLPGVPVVVQKAETPGRKTPYSLLAVWKGDRLINMDSSAPNRVFAHWVRQGGLGKAPSLIQPERRFGDSRFDFYLAWEDRTAFVEVKGVTLEEDGIARFPDAPTERGVKHIRGLIQCVEQGHDAYAAFVIQMRGVRHLEPNWATHAAFGEALREARDAGVNILALDCIVTEDSLTAHEPVPVFL